MKQASVNLFTLASLSLVVLYGSTFVDCVNGIGYIKCTCVRLKRDKCEEKSINKAQPFQVAAHDAV